MEISDLQYVGYHGKIPAFGDFVTKRLPSCLTEKWDNWLQDCISFSKQAISHQWNSTYMVAPIIRFYLQKGVVNELGWYGIMLPSVDKVGRYFPFTIFISLEENFREIDLIINNNKWFEQFELLALELLDPSLKFDIWDQKLLSYPKLSMIKSETDDQTIPIIPKNSETAICYSFSNSEVMEFHLSQYSSIFPPFHSFWWHANLNGENISEVLISTDLPNFKYFPKLIGDITRDWGWIRKEY